MRNLYLKNISLPIIYCAFTKPNRFFPLMALFLCSIISFDSLAFVTDCVTGITASPSSQTICQSGPSTNITTTINVASNTGTGNVTYQWYSNTNNSTSGGTAVGPVINSTTNAVPPSFTPPLTVGTKYYFLEVTNADAGCGGPFYSNVVTVIVNPTLVPEVEIASNDADNIICAGTPVTFTATPTNGGNAPLYQWRVNGLNVGPNSASNTFSSSGLTGESVVTVVLTSNAAPCLSVNQVESEPVTITVNQLPVVNEGPSLTAICQGGTSMAMGGSTGGGATSGTWSGGAGTWTNANNPSTATYTAGASESGPITLTLTTAGGSCGIATATKTITVNQNPTANAGGVLSAICQGGTSAVMGGSIGGGATSGTWSGGAGTWTNANNPSTATYTAGASESGPITLTLTTAGGSCGTTTATKTITVNQNPTANAGGVLTAICQGGTSAVMGGSIGGGATSGTWSGGAGTWTNANNPSTATYTAGASESGPITLTLTTAGGSCGTTTTTKTITVNQNPTANAGGALTAICQGGTSAVMGGSIGGGATSGTWSGGAGTWTNANNPSTATYTAGASESGPITLTLTTAGGSCGTTTATKTITVNQNPTANAGGVLTAICQGGTTAALGGNFGGGATSAIWSDGGAGGSFSNNSGTSPGTATYTASATSTSPVTLTLTTSGGSCGVGTASKSVTVNPILTPTVSINASSTAICTTAPAGSTPVTFSIGSSTNGGAGPTYQWRLNGNPISGATGTSYTAASLANGSQISVSMTSNATCASPVTVTSNTVTMTGYTPPAQPTFAASAGNVNIAAGICPPANGLVYTVGTSTNTTGYTWILPTGWTLVSGQGTNSITVNVTINALIGDQDIQVKANNPCGSSTNRLFTANVDKSAGVNAGPDTAVCTGTSITLDGSKTGYAKNVAWTNPSNTVLSTNEDFSYTPVITSGSIILTFSSTAEQGNLACPLVSDQMVLLVKPTATASLSITGSNPVCSGTSSSVTVTATPNTIVTYKINSGANQTINVGASGSAVLNTGNLSANATYTLVNVAYPGLPCTQILSQGVTINVTIAPTAIAGTIAAICNNSSAVNITSGATSTNASSVNWTTSGTGTIANAGSISAATYTPGTGESGAVTITLTANGTGPCSAVTSSKTLNITAAPAVNAGSAIATCSNAGAVNITAGSSASNYGTLTWSSSGTGSVANANSLANASYTPGAGETGTITVTLSATGYSPCTNINATKNLLITPAPTADAGSNIPTCSSAGPVNITAGSSASNFASIAWTSNGTGTISNPASLTNATYTPGPGETGTINLTLTATGNGTCQNATSTKNLTIKTIPAVLAGTPINTCSNDGPVNITTGSSANNYTSILWTSGGTGTIANANSLTNATYTTGPGETGTINITLTAYGNVPCGDITSTKSLTITAAPAVSAGTDIITCSDAGAVNITTGSSAGNYGSVTWTSNGTGTISNPNSLTNATYTPGPGETGNVTLTLTATGNGTCLDGISTKTITVNRAVQITSQPVATQSVCASFPVSFSVTANGTGLTYKWFKDGSVVNNVPGQISGAASPTLSISQAALANSGTYYVEVYGTSPCDFVTSANSILTVNQDLDITTQPISQVTCEGPDLEFIVAATGTISSYVWRRNGIPVSGGNYSGNNSYKLQIAGSVASNSGTYDVVISSPSGTCPQVISAPATLVVKPTPTAVPNPSSQTACSGTGITSIAITGAVPSTTFNWTRDMDVEATGIASSGSGNISGTLVNTTNAPLTVTFTITPTANGCPGTPVTSTVLLNPKPTVTALPASQPICSGASISDIILSSPVSGTTYTWTRNNPGVTGIANSGSGDISGALTNTTNAPVTVTFTITPEANGCPGNPITASVIVNPIPAVAATPSTTALCSQSNLTINLVGNVAGATYSWTPTTTNVDPLPGGNTTGSSFTQTPVASTSTNGTVSYTIVPDANGCTGTAVSVGPVTVFPLPTGSITAGISGSATICNNSGTAPVTFTGGNGTAPYTFTYRISVNGGLAGPSQTVSTVSGNSVDVPAPTTSAGSYEYQLVGVKDATTTGCPQTASGSATITVKPLPTATISGATSVCLNAAQPVITLTGTNGISPYQFTYTINGGANLTIISAGNTATLNVPTTAAGTFTYALVRVDESGATPSCGQTVSGSAAVVVNPDASITLTSAVNSDNQAVCNTLPLPTNITYQIGGTGTNATVSGLPNGMTGTYNPTSKTFTISGTPNVSGAQTSYPYTVTVTGTCANTTATGTITINPSPVGGITARTTGTPFVCQGSNAGIINLTGQAGNVLKWQSSINGGATWTDITPFNTTSSQSFLNLGQTTAYRAVISTSSCSSLVSYSTATTVSVVPQAGPGSLSAYAFPVIICSGSSTLTAIGLGADSTVGNISGGEFDNAGTQLDGPGRWKKTLIANWHPQDKINIEGSTNNADNSAFNLTNGPKTFLTTAPCSNAIPSKTVTYNNNPLGGQPNSTKFMAVVGPNTSSLETPIFNLVGLTTASIDWWEAYVLEAGASIKMEISTNGGSTYNTLLRPTVTGTSYGSPTNFSPTSVDLSAYVGLSNLRIKFTYTGTSCSTWGLEMARITKGTAPAIYTWSLVTPTPTGDQPPNHYLDVFQNPSVVVTPPSPNTTNAPITYNYSISSSSGGCVSNINVTVNPILVTSANNGNGPICSGSTMSAITFNSNVAGSSFTWSRTNGDLNSGNVQGLAATGTGATIPSATLINTTSSPQTVTFTITPANANACSPAPFTTSVTVNPNVTLALSGDQTLCGPGPQVVKVKSSGPFPVTYTLSNGQVVTMNSAADSMVTLNPALTTVGTNTLTISGISNASCAAQPFTGTATITIGAGSALPIGTWVGTQPCGSSGRDWFNPCNWGGGVLPDLNTDVIIDQALSLCDPVIDPTTSYALANGPIAYARNITIEGARNLSFANGGELDVAGNWINNTGPSGFTANTGTVKFVGNPTNTINCNSQTITTTNGNTETFYNLEIANTCVKDGTGDNVVLNNPVDVNGVLTLTDGIIKTADDKLLSVNNPAVNAVVGGSTTTYVYGPIERFTNSTGEYMFPVGSPSGPYAVYRPAIVRPESSNAASYIATYHPTIEPEDPDQTLITGVLQTEYWDIDRSSGTTNGVIKLPYIAPANYADWTTGQPCQYCVVAIAEPFGPADYWTFVNGSTNNSGYNPPQYIDWGVPGWIESPITSPFGTYSFGFFFNVILPAGDFTFNGKAQGADALLQWQLEPGNDYKVIELQHSRDGRSFKGLIAKTINGNLAFQQLHINPGPGLHYYRLVLKDGNGKVTYSSVLVIVIGTDITVLKGIRPTMVQYETYASVHSAKAQFVRLKILDMTGRTVGEMRSRLSKGENTFNVNTSMLVQGMYTVYMETEDGIKGTFKFIKE